MIQEAFVASITIVIAGVLATLGYLGRRYFLLSDRKTKEQSTCKKRQEAEALEQIMLQKEKQIKAEMTQIVNVKEENIMLILENVCTKLDMITSKLIVQDTALISMLSNSIVHIHARYMSDGKIPRFVREQAERNYDVYHNGLHANSYISDLMEDIKKLEVI